MILFQRIQIFWNLIFLTYRHNVIFQKACLLSTLGFTALTRVITKIPLLFTTTNENFHLTIVAARITYSECVSLALIIRHVKRMRHIVLSIAAFLILVYISTLSHKWPSFRKKSSRT